MVTLAIKLGVGYQEIENLIVTHSTMNGGLVGLAQLVPRKLKEPPRSRLAP